MSPNVISARFVHIFQMLQFGHSTLVRPDFSMISDILLCILIELIELQWEKMFICAISLVEKAGNDATENALKFTEVFFIYQSKKIHENETLHREFANGSDTES